MRATAPAAGIFEGPGWNLRRRALSAALVGIVLLAAPWTARALPILVVDADPGTAGVQTSRVVELGESFEVAVLIQGVEADQPLQAFELALAHGDPIEGEAVVAGVFLAEPVLVILADPSGSAARLAVTRLGAEGSAGSGVLGTFRFLATGLGASPLSLEQVLLSQPFGVPLAVGALEDGSVQVVPEPTTGLLVGGGLGALAAVRRRRGRPDSSP